MGPVDQSSSLGFGEGLKVLKLSEDGSNWVLYKSQFTSAIVARKLRRYLSGKAKAPIPPTAPGVDSDADEKYEDALDVYESNHAAIKTLLFQTLPEPLKLKILLLTKADECWKIVTDTYDDQGNFVQMGIMQQMNNLSCKDEDPHTTLLELQRLKSDYATAGGTLTDQQYKTMILASLPESYQPTIRTILTSAKISKATPTANDLLASLEQIARDDNTLNPSSSTTKDSALTADASKVKCFNCGKLGHKKPDCWSKGSGKEGQNPRRRKGKGNGKTGGTSANAATTTDDTDDAKFVFHVTTDFSLVASQKLANTTHTRLIDSGTSRHFDPHRENFVSYRPISAKPVNSADGGTFNATGEGDINVVTIFNGKEVKLTLKNVLHAPTMPIALISVSQMVKGDYSAYFEKAGCKIMTPGQKILTVIAEKNSLYPLVDKQLITLRGESALATETPTPISLTELYHKMGHAYALALKAMVKQDVIEGIELINTEVPFCKTCVKAKQSWKPFPKERSSPPATTYGQRIHSDVWGKAQVKLLRGSEYFITFLDDFSDKVIVVPMKKKSQAFTRYQEYEALLKNQRGVKAIKELQCDRGGEYTSGEFTAHLKKSGTVRRLTTHDSP